jgi:hypothetical protein
MSFNKIFLLLMTLSFQVSFTTERNESSFTVIGTVINDFKGIDSGNELPFLIKTATNVYAPVNGDSFYNLVSNDDAKLLLMNFKFELRSSKNIDSSDLPSVEIVSVEISHENECSNKIKREKFELYNNETSKK